MNEERRAGEALSRLAFGLGQVRREPKTIYAVEGHTDASAVPPKAKQGLGCSCTKRKVK